MSRGGCVHEINYQLPPFFLFLPLLADIPQDKSRISINIKLYMLQKKLFYIKDGQFY